jgi:hypothetical protein
MDLFARLSHRVASLLKERRWPRCRAFSPRLELFLEHRCMLATCLVHVWCERPPVSLAAVSLTLRTLARSSANGRQVSCARAPRRDRRQRVHSRRRLPRQAHTSSDCPRSHLGCLHHQQALLWRPAQHRAGGCGGCGCGWVWLNFPVCM